jgi:hypothetical protein
MICISDEACVQRCKDNGFPCYDYQHDKPSDPVFLQIGKLKLYYTGEALAAGVDVMLLDLDVSFLRDPLELMVGFLDNETEHVRCQMDLIYSTKEDENGNTYWYSHPGPNFGLFVAKASQITKLIFKEAWRKYQKVPLARQNRVALDQNVMNGALQGMQWRQKMQFVTYFFIGTDSSQNKKARVRRDLLTPLLDKIEYYSPEHIRFELGASAARQELGAAIAVHATCYEGSTKLLALKAVNAFWDIRYYNPSERTLTKPLMLVTSVADLRMELRALAYLALKTNRSLIIPNVLIGAGSGIRGKDASRSACRSKGGAKCDATLLEVEGAWASLPPLSPPASRRLLADEHLDLDWGMEEEEQGEYWLEEWEEEGEGEEANWSAEAYAVYVTNYSDGVTHRNLADAPPKKKKRKKMAKKQGGVFDPLVMYHNQTHTAKNR